MHAPSERVSESASDRPRLDLAGPMNRSVRIRAHFELTRLALRGRHATLVVLTKVLSPRS